MDVRTAKNLGRLFIALTAALPEEGRQKAHDAILDIIDSPQTTPEDREYWRIVLGIETVEERRKAFSVIEGGDA